MKAVDLEVQPARTTAHKGAKQQSGLKFDAKQIVVRDLVRSQKRASRSHPKLVEMIQAIEEL